MALKWFKKEDTNWQTPANIAKRASMVRTAELPMFAEQALYDISNRLTLWRTTQDESHLKDAMLSSRGLVAILEECYRRLNYPGPN